MTSTRRRRDGQGLTPEEEQLRLLIQRSLRNARVARRLIIDMEMAEYLPGSPQAGWVFAETDKIRSVLDELERLVKDQEKDE